ncbi:MAG: glycoside hydrolase [Clostridia bacterium]|nr:glycoside hydrolase [Clostridia bacterium]
MEDWKTRFILTPGDPPNDGILFADHAPLGRSGHMGHALVEYAPGKVLAFYPNCSAEDTRWNGHSGYGWMEYRRTTDAGKTWSEPIIEPNSKALFDAQVGKSRMCEKAVTTDSGDILLFYLTCDMVTNGHIWEPDFAPCYAKSSDGGETWSEPRTFTDAPGRVYDVLKKDGAIYVLFFQNAELPGIAHSEEHPYQLFVSEDDGETFTLRAEIPFESTIGCLYGTMAFFEDGRLIVYIYDEHDEYNPKYILSDDGGFTWGINRRAFFPQKIRNPQLINFHGTWFMHGRSGSFGKNTGHFILYSSPDAIHWDEGTFLRMATEGAGAYSNNLVVHDPAGNDRLLIQSSHAYDKNKTNTVMWWLDIRK